MIAEPGIVSTSSWNSDLLLKDLQSDFYKSYVNVTDGLDMGFPLMEYELDRCRSVHGDSVAAFGSSGSPSSASSDCSEELSFDFVWQPSDSASLHIPDHDYLNSSLNLLDGNGVTVCPEEFDWVVGDNFVANSLLDCVDYDPPRAPSCSRPRCSRPVDPVTDTKLWSRMSLEDRLEAVEGLTTIISNQMGLREQLDIIRIIEPSANISATDTEFVIDLNALDDRKLCGVREYVKKVQIEQRAKLEKKPTSPTKATSCSSGKNSHSKSAPCGSSGFNSNNSSSSSGSAAGAASNKGSPGKNGHQPSKAGPSLGKGKHSKKEAKEKEKRPPPQKVFQKRQRKEHRQLLKERRSGLFQKEQVLSLSVLPVIEEDVDIDILD